MFVNCNRKSGDPIELQEPLTTLIEVGRKLDGLLTKDWREQWLQEGGTNNVTKRRCLSAEFKARVTLETDKGPTIVDKYRPWYQSLLSPLGDSND